MKKKKIIIISVIVLLIIIILAVILIVKNMNKGKHKSFLSDDYPITYENKDGNVIIKLDGKKTPNANWTASFDDNFVDVVQDGKTSKGTATYVISPKSIGFIYVTFDKSIEISGITVVYGSMTFPIEVYESPEGALIAECKADPVYESEDDLIGENTDYPVIINHHYYLSDEEMNTPLKGDLFFINGQGDWTLESPDGYADFDFYSEDGYEFVFITRGYGQVEGSDSEIPPADYEEEQSESKKQPEPDESKIEEGKVEPGVIVATMTDSVEENSPEQVDSAEIILSNEALGISETLIVSFRENGMVAVSRKTDEGK